MVYSFSRGSAGIGQGGKATVSAEKPFAALRELRAYWEALREGETLPRREQVNPRGMAGALHQVFMVERVAPGVARFRLAGMEISDLMGMEVRGMPISALFDPMARERFAELVEKVAVGHSIVELGLEAEPSIGRPAIQARMLLLPLKGSDGEADLILGCLACEGQVGRAPRRFAIVRAMEQRLPARENTTPKVENQPTATRTSFVAQPAPRVVTELAEPSAPRFDRPNGAQGRSHLRLVHSEG